jgi:hypothetical protein
MSETAPDIQHIAMPPKDWERSPGSNHELPLLREIVGGAPVDKLVQRASELPIVTIAAYNLELYRALAALSIKPE